MTGAGAWAPDLRRWALLLAGTATLALAWLGPLPRLAEHRFSAHMTMHIAVVAIAAPLVALAVAGSRLDPARSRPRLFAAVPLSILELVVVWGWHAPAAHQAARGSLVGLVAEQGSFLLAALPVWLASFGGDAERASDRTGAGVIALLVTSIHMTLLGALIALAPRPLYEHGSAAGRGGALVGGLGLTEQELGGTIMLLVGGASYLSGGLALAAALLRDGSAGARRPARSARESQRCPEHRRRPLSEETEAR